LLSFFIPSKSSCKRRRREKKRKTIPENKKEKAEAKVTPKTRTFASRIKLLIYY